MVESPLLWIAAAGGLGIGALVGYLLARGGAQRDRSRVRDLEAALGRAEAVHAQYRTQVSEHFVETSRRLHDLTVQYKSVYEHLADGARTLCPEGAVAIASSLAEAALPARAGSEPAEDEAQLDLALDTPASWTSAERDDDLDLLLDDETPAPPVIDPPRAS